MSRTTIDYGIDLGTTNSAIAVLKGVSTEIFKNNDETDVTPSAVSIDKKGAVSVGHRAKNRSIDKEEDAYLEFKRNMGTNFEYVFRESKQHRKPEELSAEILKSLRSDVQQRSGEIIDASVITVPAAFELHQCDATRKAAILAGFKICPLLQEPVAAALAHGFQADKKKAYWLVYDFGGGTFDAAVIKSEEGTIHVYNHGGDNFLGGSDIDWAIVEKIVAPRIISEYGLDDFRRGNRIWTSAFRKLKHHVETAKIHLSRNERTTLDSIRFMDDKGGNYEFECDLTQTDIAGAAEPFIAKSIEICLRVLKEKNLGPDVFEKVVLVGGPTLAPYFRKRLEEGLGMPLDFSGDPLTVVARGAAIFAGTQKTKRSSVAPAKVGEYTLELANSFKPVGMESAPIVGGKFIGQSGQLFSGFTVELINSRTKWRSGKTSLRPDGVFIATLHAERGERNTFNVELADSTGMIQIVNPATLTYTVGAVVEEQPLINSMGIALANNERYVYFEKGKGLPLKATHEFRTIKAVRKGETDDVLRAPIIEGENEKADRNRMIDELVITGTNVRRDLPASSEIEVTLEMDESRIITVTAYCPYLDEEFTTKIDMQRHMVTKEALEKDYQAECARLKDLNHKAQTAGDTTAKAILEQLEGSELMDEVTESLSAAESDKSAAIKCEKRLLELKLKLDEAEDSLEWPLLVKKAEVWINYLKGVLGESATEIQKSQAALVIKDAEKIIRERKTDLIKKKTADLNRLYFEIVTSQPAWWAYQFQIIEKDKGKIVDAGRAHKLFEQGRECMAQNNAIGLQSIVRGLWDLLPSQVVQDVQRGYRSGLVQ